MEQTILELRDSRGSRILGYESGERGNLRGFQRWMGCSGLKYLRNFQSTGTENGTDLRQRRDSQ